MAKYSMYKIIKSNHWHSPIWNESSQNLIKKNRTQNTLKWNEWHGLSVPYIQPIRPLAELTEHCPAVVFYWRLVFVNVSRLLRC